MASGTTRTAGRLMTRPRALPEQRRLWMRIGRPEHKALIQTHGRKGE
jgi:hypothetical protein